MIWRTIPNFSHYEISEYGDVRRHAKVVVAKVGHRKKPGIHLKASTSKYPCYALVNDFGHIKQKRMSHLVLLAFVGPAPTAKHQALHWDDIQANNHYKNLRWGTSKDNGVDRVRNNTTASGAKNGSAKLTDEIVILARADYASGYTLHELVHKYQITLCPIWSAVTGRSWKHLPGAVPCKGQGARTDLRSV